MRRIWLASYPKCGNTWFRMVVRNLCAQDGATQDINTPAPGGTDIASSRTRFDQLTLIDSGLLTHEEIDELRPGVHRAWAEESAEAPAARRGPAAPPVTFIKTHDAYTLTRSGLPLLAGAAAADGAILIVRDPRDVACSLANHLRASIDRAIRLMNDPQGHFCGDTDRQHRQLRQQLADWSGFIAGWLRQTDLPVHCLRYEDMHTDPVGSLARALDFAGHPATRSEIGLAVERARFSTLRAQEDQHGFFESPRLEPGGRFFRRGLAGGWRDELTPEQAARIEAAHAPMMARFGYARSADDIHP